MHVYTLKNRKILLDSATNEKIYAPFMLHFDDINDIKRFSEESTMFIASDPLLKEYVLQLEFSLLREQDGSERLDYYDIDDHVFYIMVTGTKVRGLYPLITFGDSYPLDNYTKSEYDRVDVLQLFSRLIVIQFKRYSSNSDAEYNWVRSKGIISLLEDQYYTDDDVYMLLPHIVQCGIPAFIKDLNAPRESIDITNCKPEVPGDRIPNVVYLESTAGYLYYVLPNNVIDPNSEEFNERDTKFERNGEKDDDANWDNSNVKWYDKNNDNNSDSNSIRRDRLWELYDAHKHLKDSEYYKKLVEKNLVTEVGKLLNLI